jgi:preprotein translocase subunit SecG
VAFLEQLLLIIHVIAAISVIGLVLLQQGKGAEVGASFGSGASQTVFGSQGSASFLSRSTAVAATLFFLTSLGLGYVTHARVKPASLDKALDSLLNQIEVPKTPE